ncbi:MAG TPA: hypothetical protein VGE04_19925, partial [Chloroflexia bacterium]
EILMMADALSGGIVAQFPDRFGATAGGGMVGMPRTGTPFSPFSDASIALYTALALVLVAVGIVALKQREQS